MHNDRLEQEIDVNTGRKLCIISKYVYGYQYMSSYFLTSPLTALHQLITTADQSTEMAPS